MPAELGYELVFSLVKDGDASGKALDLLAHDSTKSLASCSHRDRSGTAARVWSALAGRRRNRAYLIAKTRPKKRFSELSTEKTSY
jgi:hypothetical protein